MTQGPRGRARLIGGAERVGQRGGVGINASIIGDNPTGLGLYAINLIRSLDAIRDDLRVYTSCPDALGGLRARVLSATTARAAGARAARASLRD